MLYIPIFILLPLFFINEISNKRKIAIYFVFSGDFSIIAVRYGIGADYFSYKDMYNSISKTDVKQVFTNYYKIEVGYIFLMLCFKRLNFSYELFAFILNMVSLIIFSLWIHDNKSEEDAHYSYLLFYTMFFTVWILSTFRQSLTVAISLYLLWNEKFKFTTIRKIIIILLLSLIHKSVLIMLVYLFLESLQLNKRKILYLFILSLLFNLIPLSIIERAIVFIPNSSKVLHYMTSSRSLYSLPSLIRMFFFVLFYISYLLNSDSKYDKLFRFHLYGYILYFILKFSEITASRATTYSYVSIVILLPISLKIIIETLTSLNPRFMRFLNSTLLTAIILSFAFISLTKELNTLKFQTGYVGNFKTFKIPTILDKNPEDFKTQYGLKELLRIESQNDLERFSQRITSDYHYTQEDSFTSVFDPRHNKFTVINQKGEVASHRYFYYKPKVYGNLYEEIDESNVYRNMYYREVAGSNSQNKLAMVENKIHLSEIIDRQKVYVFDDTVFENSEFDSARSLLDSFEMDYQILDIAKYTQPIKYTIVRFKMENNVYFILQDNEGKLYANKIFSSYKRFDSNGFIELISANAKYIYYKDGSLSWVEPLGGNND